jgi:hypothetical protein
VEHLLHRPLGVDALLADDLDGARHDIGSSSISSCASNSDAISGRAPRDARRMSDELLRATARGCSRAAPARASTRAGAIW